MSDTAFRDACLAQPVISEREHALRDLAKRYHTECERYDRTVCTARSREGIAMPVNRYERAQISRHALFIRQLVINEGRTQGFDSAEVARAISEWDEPIV